MLLKYWLWRARLRSFFPLSSVWSQSCSLVSCLTSSQCCWCGSRWHLGHAAGRRTGHKETKCCSMTKKDMPASTGLSWTLTFKQRSRAGPFGGKPVGRGAPLSSPCGTNQLCVFAFASSYCYWLSGQLMSCSNTDTQRFPFKNIKTFIYLFGCSWFFWLPTLIQKLLSLLHLVLGCRCKVGQNLSISLHNWAEKAGTTPSALCSLADNLHPAWWT